MLNSLFSAFLMYSRIPAPKTEWKEENRRYALGFFPVIGAVIGVSLILWRYICNIIVTGDIIFAAGAVCIPVIITGGIHIDGFCDVTDARSSYADKEKRLEILSDPHIGSFAVIHICLYFLIQTAMFTKLAGLKECVAVGCGYVLSRSLSSLSAILFKAAKKDGTLQSFVKPSHKKITVCMALFFMIVSSALMIILSPTGGITTVCSAFATMLLCRRAAYRDFGGYTGDVCGWFLQICELAILITFIISGMITEVLT